MPPKRRHLQKRKREVHSYYNNKGGAMEYTLIILTILFIATLCAFVKLYFNFEELLHKLNSSKDRKEILEDEDINVFIEDENLTEEERLQTEAKRIAKNSLKEKQLKEIYSAQQLIYKKRVERKIKTLVTWDEFKNHREFCNVIVRKLDELGISHFVGKFKPYCTSSDELKRFSVHINRPADKNAEISIFEIHNQHRQWLQYKSLLVNYYKFVVENSNELHYWFWFNRDRIKDDVCYNNIEKHIKRIDYERMNKKLAVKTDEVPKRKVKI